jgi:hypothetical protein
MGRRQGQIVTRHRIAAALLLALGVAGCGGNSNVQFSSGGPPPPQGSGVSVYGANTLGTLLTIGFIGAALSGGYRAPEMDPSRRVVEQDCTKPIEDWSANLRCR